MAQEWFYARGGSQQQQGPVDEATLRQLLASGQLLSNDLIWRDGMPNWQPAGTIPEFQGAAAPQQPPPGSVPPPGAQPGMVQPNYYGDPAAQQLQSKAQTAMIVGIISIVLSACVCGPAGIALGIWGWMAGSKIPPGYAFSGQGKAGMICGIIGTILGGLSTIATIIYFVAVAGTAAF